MIEPCRAPLGVALHARRIGHPQLACDVVEDHRRHVQRVDQEQPQRSHRHQLKRETEPQMIHPTPVDQPQIGIIEQAPPGELGR
jgi:hypothetical protein